LRDKDGPQNHFQRTLRVWLAECGWQHPLHNLGGDMKKLALAAALCVLALPAAAQVAQPLQPFLVNHNNSIMLVRPLPGSGNEVVIEYAKPRPSLYGLVGPGTTLVRGRWVGPNDFIGTAWVFSRLCGPMPYAVRGGLDRPLGEQGDASTLVLVGAAPQFDTSCRVLYYSLQSTQAVLRFEYAAFEVDDPQLQRLLPPAPPEPERPIITPDMPVVEMPLPQAFPRWLGLGR
jgi:hypothetical protein